MPKSTLKAAGIFVVGYSLSLGSCRAILDLTDELELNKNCVTKTEIPRFSDYFTFNHCENGKKQPDILA